MTESTPAWLTTSQAAARLGISERTVQRRCQSGKLACRRVTNDTGEVWEVEAATLPTGDATPAIGDAIVTTGVHSQSSDGADTPAMVTPQADDTDAIVTTLKSDVPTSAAIGDDSVTPPDLLSELLEEKDKRIADLRAQVESQRLQIEAANRQATEATAALREALRMQNKALPEPGDTSARSTPVTPPDGPQRAPEAPPVAASVPASGRRKGWLQRLFGE